MFIEISVIFERTCTLLMCTFMLLFSSMTNVVHYQLAPESKCLTTQLTTVFRPFMRIYTCLLGLRL